MDQVDQMGTMGAFDYALSPVSKDRRGPISGQIVDLVVKNIEKKNLVPGQKLPTERELAEAFGVARGTVKAAYKKLEQGNVIRTRQGSGSYVIRDEELSRKLSREKAVTMLHQTIGELGELGLSHAEMLRLFERCLAQNTRSMASVAIIFESAEILLDLSRQLSYLPNASISIFILESITENREPEELLRDFDIILVSSRYCADILELLPNLAPKVVEAAVAPSSETLISLTALPRDARIGIICRTNVFLSTVKSMLLLYGFAEENILSFFEMDYTTETYFPGGIDALVSFSDAHIFTNPDFAFRNEEFWAKGGRIIAYKHQLDRGTLIYIENQIGRLNLDSES